MLNNTSNGDWWVSIVKWTIWGLVMTGAMGWVARSRLRQRSDAERHLLVHPLSTLIVGAVGAVFFFGVAIVSNTIGKNATTTVWTTLGFMAFGFACVPMIADYFFARHRLSADGIEYGRMFGQRGSLRWSDIRRVWFAPAAKWFVLESTSGAKVRVSAMLIGLPEFARLVLLHVPKAAIESHTLAVLQATEEGNPPRIWQ